MTKPPPTLLGTCLPRVKCPTGRRRFSTEDTARAHRRVSHGGSVAVACERCGGWHHARGNGR